MNERLRSGVALLSFVLSTLAVGWIGSRVTLPEIPGWYAQLAKPAYTPPNWVFGPVWTTLYLMMAIAGWLMWRSPERARSRALALWGVQLALNLGWSLLFFGTRQIGLALLEIAVLLLAIAATIAASVPLSRVAALLLAPYFAWVAYAAALNLAIWRFNT